MQLTGLPFLGRLSPVVSYRNHYENTTNQADFTFTAADIGPAAGNRHVITCVGVRASLTAPDLIVTVGGAACTEVIRCGTTSNGFPSIFITTALFPTGATANIVIDGNQTSVCCGIDVYAVYGLNLATAVTTAQNAADNTALAIAGLAVGSIVIGCSTQASGATVTMTGITENSDREVESAQMNMAAGHAANVSGSNNVTFDWTSSTNVRSVAAAFR